MHANDLGEQGTGRAGGRRGAERRVASLFQEAIDRRTGRIRASGLLDDRAADMLLGTVEALRHSGCPSVVLDLGGVDADDAAVDAVRALERTVTADGGHVTLVNWPDRGHVRRR